MEDYRSGKKSLEAGCYIAGAGAFGVFLRWLQLQLAFNELGLADKSVFHWIVAAFILASALIFASFVRRYSGQQLSLPDDFSQSFRSDEHRLYLFVRIAAGAVLFLGGLLLIYQSGTDRNASDYRVIGILAMFSGLSFPVWLGSANRETKPAAWLLCLLSFFPMLLMAAWMVICYKLNTINSVAWSYIIELLAIVAGMFAFFRLGGFVFEKPNWKRCMFDCFLGAMLCIMALADERYLGLQIVFVGLALELLLCSWIMVKNLQKGDSKPAAPEKENTGGFEKL
ncbi:MAG: MFS transporter [Oscillospiraceae bacterium]|nr:MFS transporter [Oscillospiraceae bacterium]